MNDSDWQDPFEDDERAQERERRRAERAARRRQREEGTRQALGERVREQRGNDPAPEQDPKDDVADQPARSEPKPPLDPGSSRTSEHTGEHEPYGEPGSGGLAPADPHADAPGPAEWPSSRRHHLAWRRESTIRRRRFAGVLALLALVGALAATGYAVSNSGGDAPAPAPPAKPKKTAKVGIPEGLTREEMAKIAKKAGLKGNYMKASRSSKKIKLAKYGAKDAKNLEGFLFPATYELFKGATAQDLVDKQVEAFQDNLGSIDLGYAKSKKLSPYDVTIIASMIEREIQVPDERKLASSVIYNRLKQGTPLGIDATIRYEDDNFTKPLVASRLKEDTPYNTRTNTGLPPGPIGNPGLASLQAAANPAKTDYFFYVAKPGTCGESSFLKTQAEFDAAEAKYNAAREAAGGKAPTDC